jgi:hypothetical protein
VNISIPGVTDNVVNYTYTGMSFPCIILKEGFKCQEHKMIVLSKMVKMSSMEVKDINLYFSNNGELFKIGMLSGMQVKPFLSIVGIDNIDAFYDNGLKLEGDKVYVLCA